MRFAIVFVLAMAAPAFAQKPDAAAAFDRGKKAMAAGDTAKACEEFETSMRFEAANGTLYNLALCHEKLGKVATAWTEFNELATNDTNSARAKDSKKHASALEPKLTRMHIAAPKTPGVVIERDGKDVTSLAGTDEPVDPGSYTFVARAPGHKPQTVLADLRAEGKTVNVDIPELEAETAPIAAPSDEYSTRLPLRPLVLPKGMAELGANTTIYSGKFDQTPIDFIFGARYSFGKVEVAANLAFHGQYSTTTNKPTQPGYAGIAARYALTPMFAFEVAYTDSEPRASTKDLSGSAYSAAGARKYVLANNVAVVARGGVEYQSYAAPCFHPTDFSAIGDGHAQFAATDRLSFEGAAFLSVHLDGKLYTDTFGLVFGGSGQYAILRNFDAYAAARFPAKPTTDATTYIIGLAWRTR